MPPNDGVDKRKFVREILDNRFADYHAWPANIFKLECESYDAYQNVTGSVQDDLIDNDVIDKVYVELNGNQRPFLTRPNVDPEKEEPEIVALTKKFYEATQFSGQFAELTAYIALSAVYDELQDSIYIDVLPEGERSHLLRGSNRKPDGVILLPGEYVPVEVYNGRDYLGTNTSKYNQLKKYTNEGEEGLNSYPFLINRRSDDVVKREVRKMNGMVVDTDCIMMCEISPYDIKDITQKLHVWESIAHLPQLESTDGIKFDGNKYHHNSRNKAESIFPLKMAPAATELPQHYMKRIRGGVQLQYVNTFYRRSSDRTRRDACFVLQTIYNRLLRYGGQDKQAALDDGWTSTIERYRRIKSADRRKEMILDEASGLLSRLQDENLIVKRNGEIHARKAVHPPTSDWIQSLSTISPNEASVAVSSKFHVCKECEIN